MAGAMELTRFTKDISIMILLETITLSHSNGFQSTIELIENDEMINVWETTTDGKEIILDTFISFDLAKNWALNSYLPNQYGSSYEVI